MGYTRKKRNTKNKTKKIYSTKDYSSGEGMMTSVWGPGMWHYLHTMSFNYPINPTATDKKKYKLCITNLQYTLPCKYCRINLKNNFKHLPLTNACMSSRDTFSRYVYDLHELINKMLKKKSNLTYSEVRDRYEHFRARCSSNQNKIFRFTKKHGKELGCTRPMYGHKSKCIIKIVPHSDKSKTFQMDKKCIKQKS
jgi:hypothetical protein